MFIFYTSHSKSSQKSAIFNNYKQAIVNCRVFYSHQPGNSSFLLAYAHVSLFAMCKYFASSSDPPLYKTYAEKGVNSPEDVNSQNYNVTHRKLNTPPDSLVSFETEFSFALHSKREQD